MPLHAHCSRRAASLLASDAAARERADGVETWLRASGILRPAPFAEMMVPGFSDARQVRA
jgi:hypothetical protein